MLSRGPVAWTCAVGDRDESGQLAHELVEGDVTALEAELDRHRRGRRRRRAARGRGGRGRCSAGGTREAQRRHRDVVRVGALLQQPQQRGDVGLRRHRELERSPLCAVGLQRSLRRTTDVVALLSRHEGLLLSGDLRLKRAGLLALWLEGDHVERTDQRDCRHDDQDDAITFAEAHCALPVAGVVVVDAAGVAAGVVEVEVGVVAPVVVLVLDGAARSSDSEKDTGNGHPLLEEPEPEEAELEPAPLFEVEDSATELTPWTRPSATMVAATADWLAAQPEIWMGWAVGAGALVAAAAASGAADRRRRGRLQRVQGGIGRHHSADLAEEQGPREPAGDKLPDVSQLLLLLLRGSDVGRVAVGGSLPAGGVGGHAGQLALARPDIVDGEHVEHRGDEDDDQAADHAERQRTE